jgi:hypothetical protein
MKKSVRFLTVLALLSVVGAPLVAHATTYFPFVEDHRQLKEKAIMKVGSIVYVFHSGTPDIKKTITINDVLIVYRESPSCDMKEVGKIKVLSYAGENYLKVEVIEGEIKLNDIARKGPVSFLVILSEDRCKGAAIVVPKNE